MPATIVFRHPTDPGDPDENIATRFENTVNTPILSATYLDNGQGIAGQYTLTFTNAAGSVSVAITCPDSKNPYIGTAIPAVADGTTPNNDVLPGVSLVFDAATDTGWIAVVGLYCRTTSAGVMSRVLDFGTVTAGAASTEQRIAAVNVGDEQSEGTEVYALPSMYFTPADACDFIAEIRPHTDPTYHASAPKATLTVNFADWKDAGGGKKSADVLVGGVKTIEDAIFDGSTRYQYGSANGYIDAVDGLEGLSLILADTVADPTSLTVTIVVMDGDQWLEFAPDSGGSAGAWQSTSLELTEIGEDGRDHHGRWPRLLLGTVEPPRRRLRDARPATNDAPAYARADDVGGRRWHFAGGTTAAGLRNRPECSGAGVWGSRRRYLGRSTTSSQRQKTRSMAALATACRSSLDLPPPLTPSACSRSRCRRSGLISASAHYCFGQCTKCRRDSPETSPR